MIMGLLWYHRTLPVLQTCFLAEARTLYHPPSKTPHEDNEVIRNTPALLMHLQRNLTKRCSTKSELTEALASLGTTTVTWQLYSHCTYWLDCGGARKMPWPFYIIYHDKNRLVRRQMAESNIIMY